MSSFTLKDVPEAVDALLGDDAAERMEPRELREEAAAWTTVAGGHPKPAHETLDPAWEAAKKVREESGLWIDLGDVKDFITEGRH